MSQSKRTALTVGAAAAIGIAIGASGLVSAQAPNSPFQNSPLMKSNDAGWSSKPDAGLADLGNHEGVFVARGTFHVVRGKSKVDTSSLIAKMGAKEVSHGAIIFRSGDKLYIVDGKPASDAPQAMKDFNNVWAGSNLMKSFDDGFSPLMR